MKRESRIEATIAFVKGVLQGAEGEHDWWHVYRVWKTAKTIAAGENVDTFIIELGALLHDRQYLIPNARTANKRFAARLADGIAIRFCTTIS